MRSQLVCKHHSMSQAQFEYAASREARAACNFIPPDIQQIYFLSFMEPNNSFFKGFNRFKGVDTYRGCMSPRPLCFVKSGAE